MKNKLKNFLFKKEDGLSAIVVAVILVVIAVALALVFKDQLAALIQKIFNKADAKIDAELS